MNIKKLFIGVFLSTFLFGVIAYFLVPKRENKIIRKITSETIPKKTVQTTPAIIKEELETLEEVGGWVDEEKYPFKIKLLTTGEGFHGDEVEAKTGETWLGLFQENDKYFLRSTKLNIKRVYDDIIDYKKNQTTGKTVSVKGKNQPLFLLKNSRLSNGAVQSLFRGTTWREVIENYKESELSFDEIMTTMKKDFVHNFEIKNKKFALKVIEAKNKNDEKILALITESEGTRQVLHTMRESDEFLSIGDLIWAGDLDRDGKPDFYMTLFEHYNVGNSVLFLSSEAENGKLVKKVAYFWTTGC